MLEEMRQHGASVFDREAAIVLRAIERGAREARTHNPSPTAYLTLLGRLLQVSRAAQAAGSAEPQPQPASSIILP
jgi:hypothetical protein